MYIHLLAYHLLMGQHHFDDLPTRIRLALQALVETRLLYAEVVGQILLQRVGTSPRIISAQLDNGASGLREGDLGVRDRQAVFVEHS